MQIRKDILEHILQFDKCIFGYKKALNSQRSRVIPVTESILSFFLSSSLEDYEWVVGLGVVLGSFQCWGVLLLWHIVGQGPAVLAAGAGRVGCFLIL